MSKSQKSLLDGAICDQQQDQVAQFRHHLNGQAEAERYRRKNVLVGDYRTLCLRRFGRAKKNDLIPTLIIPPLAVHDAAFLDLFSGHSLIEALQGAGQETLHLADWRALTAESAEQSLDARLSDLLVAIEDLGGRVNLVGLSLGGLFGLLLAARFPAKIGKLVLAGTPVDTDAQLSLLTYHARKLQTLPVDLVAAEDWLKPLALTQGAELCGLDAMQRDPGSFSRADLDALAAFGRWTQRKGDLSGLYLRELLSGLLKNNDLMKGKTIALGRRIDLKNIHAPIFVLAGLRDEIVPRRQVMNVLDAVGTSKSRQRSLQVETGHYGLFLGQYILKREWRIIAGWLQSKAPLAQKAA